MQTNFIFPGALSSLVSFESFIDKIQSRIEIVSLMHFVTYDFENLTFSNLLFFIRLITIIIKI